MPYQVLIAALSFQKVDPENPMVPIGEPEVVERGGMVPDYATTFLVNSLSNAGVIVPVSEPDPRLFPAEEAPMQPRNPDAPLVLPGGPVAPPLTIGTDGTLTDGPEIVADDEPDADPSVRPSTRDNKAAWEAYAEQVGVDRATAESMTKAELVAEVERREETPPVL
jgi:predicted component of type VI protein secretion system